MLKLSHITFGFAFFLAAATGCSTSNTVIDSGPTIPPCSPACGANSTCNVNPDGTGTCACYQNYVNCPGSDGGAVCSNVKLDNDNCGGCGTVCPTGESCLGGICTCHLTTCVSDAGTSTCTDPESDPLNCGQCGTVCDPGEECLLGVCTCVTTPTIAECTVDGGLQCVNLTMDDNNCGGCGNVCSGNQHCAAPAGAGGTCVCNNGGPNTAVENCDQACVDTDQDPFNCGGCGNVCVSGSCILGDAGAGICNCPLPYTQCGPDCVDTYSDINHCGSCDNDCTIIGAGITELTCNLGHCYCGPTGQGIICPDGTCSTLGNDPNNCGTCGNVCLAPAQDCINGTCSCPDSQSLCGQPDAGVPLFCIDTTEDSQNCGSCGNICTVTYAQPVPPTDYVGCRFGLCICDPTNAHLCASSNPGGLPTCTCPASTSACATLSFANDVYPLLAQQTGAFGCSASGCHAGANPSAGLAFLDSNNNQDAGMAYAELLLPPPAMGNTGPAVPYCDGGVPPDAPASECACVSRVTSGNINASYLIDVLLNDLPGTCPATRAMPLDDAGGWTPLSSCSQQFMQQWVNGGANP
jgi:hypothetical protein